MVITDSSEIWFFNAQEHHLNITFYVSDVIAQMYILNHGILLLKSLCRLAGSLRTLVSTNRHHLYSI